MGFRPGDKVAHIDDKIDFGIGHIVEDRGVIAGVQMFRVAWPMPESGNPQTLSIPADLLRPATDEELGR
jgi:hypothetical protein